MATGVSPSMALALAGFCFSLIFIAFVCSRLACALLRRHRRRARSRLTAVLPRYAAAAADYAFAVHVQVHHPAAGGGGGGGLGPAAVAALPSRAFAAAPRGSGASDADDSQCVICLAEYEEGDVLRILPRCGHDFHMACIDLWLEQNSTCPVCRISLLDIPDDSEHAAPPPPLPNVVVISPPSSPEPSGSDPCRCLFAGTGHSSREAPRHEQPEQENQVASRPSVDGAGSNIIPLSEVNPTPENNSQTVRKQQLGPCK